MAEIVITVRVGEDSVVRGVLVQLSLGSRRGRGVRNVPSWSNPEGQAVFEFDPVEEEPQGWVVASPGFWMHAGEVDGRSDFAVQLEQAPELQGVVNWWHRAVGSVEYSCDGWQGYPGWRH